MAELRVAVRSPHVWGLPGRRTAGRHDLRRHPSASWQICSWGLGRGPLRWRAILVLATLPCATIVWSTRPQLATYCFVPLWVWLLLHRRWMLTVLVAVLWANLHGGAAYAVLLAGTAATVAAVRNRATLRPYVLATGTALVAGLCTPLALDYWPAIVQSIARSRANGILEWQPPGATLALAPFWLTAVSLVILAVTRRRRLSTFEELFLIASAVVVLPLAVGSLRNVPVFLLLAVPALSRLVWSDRPSETEPAVEPWRARLHGVILAISIAGLTAVVVHRWGWEPERMAWKPMSSAAAAAIRQCNAPIYNGYNEGGILVWFVPGQPVFIDSRQDPYPVSLVQAHARAERSGNYDPLFARFGIQCAVFQSHSEGPRRLATRGWGERFRDDQWVVMERH